MLGRRGLLAGASMVASWPVWGQVTAPSGADVAGAVAAAPDQRAPEGASIDEQMQNFVDDSGFGARERRGELSLLRGSAAVECPGNDPRWVAFRSLAYENALLSAQSDYVSQQNKQLSNESISEMFKAAGLEPPPYKREDTDPTKTAELIRKLVALGNGTLDKELRGLGIDPTTYERAPEPQRYIQMRAALSLKSMTKAFGELTGVMPVQTFEARLGGDSIKGDAYKIGVVAVVSTRMKEFAQRVLRDRGQFQPEPTKAAKLAELFADTTKLIRDFGVRWRYDEGGLPVIVSFAQWMSDYHGQDLIAAERYKDVAFKQAEARADGQIADFLKGSVDVQSTSEIGQQITAAANRMPDEYVGQEAEARTLMNAYMSAIRRRSQVSLTGLTTLSRWSAKHPDTGQEIIGAIRIWSAAGEKQVRALRDGRPPAAAAAGRATGPGPVQTGRKLMDASDF